MGDSSSPNLREIVHNFELRDQIPRLPTVDGSGTGIERLLSPAAGLSPNPAVKRHGPVKQPGLHDRGMGFIWEDLVRRLNEDNNEAVGNPSTPRDAVKLMAKLIFLPAAGRIGSGTCLLHGGDCGTRRAGQR